MKRGAGHLLAALALATAAVVPAEAATAVYRIDPEASSLTFLGTSRLVNADGRFRRFTGEVTLDTSDFTSARVKLTIDAASLDTDNYLRDQHLRSDEFFWVQRHPAITFETVRTEGTGRQATVRGRLNLRGVTREVSVPVAVEIGERELVAKGTFELRRTDYGMTYQSWLNPVGDAVRVSFTFRATRVGG